MSDLISRKALLKEFEEANNRGNSDLWHITGIKAFIESQPSIEPPKGEWIDVEEFYFDYRCSLCGGLSEFYTPFCQHCGAAMKEKV